MREVWTGQQNIPENEASYYITPLLKYDNHTTNPISLYNMLWLNVQSLDPKILPYPNLKSVNKFVDNKREELMDRWFRVKSCNAKHDEARRLARENPHLYEFKRKNGEFDCDKNEPLIPRYQPTPIYDKEIQQHNRLTLGPTIPPIIGCDPTPPCYDLCCLIRSLLVLFVQLLEMSARFFNGLIQGSVFLTTFFLVNSLLFKKEKNCINSFPNTLL